MVFKNPHGVTLLQADDGYLAKNTKETIQCFTKCLFLKSKTYHYE